MYILQSFNTDICLNVGVWSGRDVIGPLLRPKKVFKPTTSIQEQQKKIESYKHWKRACLHFAGFHDNNQR